MYSSLARINHELTTWAGGARPGASSSEILSLRSRSKSVLGISLPQTYCDLLAKNNGLNFLFLSIYGTQAFKTASLPTKRVPGFVEANMRWRKKKGLPNMVVFADTMNELHIYNVDEDEYQTIDSLNGLPFEHFKNATALFSHILHEGLY